MIQHTDLATSPVWFDEATHTYTSSDGRTLPGVTSILKAVLFPDKYAGIPESVLKKAAERGTAIHNECQAINLFGQAMLSDHTSPEARAYTDLIHDLGITMVANEYLVSDDKRVASMIDCIDAKGNIYDIKTTRTLDKESVSWQLSFYDWLFDRQNPFLERPENNLYAIWLRGDKAEIVPVERKPTAEILKVLDAFERGEVLSLEPTLKLADSEARALIELSNQEQAIIELKQAIEAYEEAKKANLALLQQAMQKQGLKKLETDKVLVTLVADSTSRTLDSKALRADHPELAEKYTKETTRKGYVKITLRQ